MNHYHYIVLHEVIDCNNVGVTEESHVDLSLKVGKASEVNLQQYM